MSEIHTGLSVPDSHYHRAVRRAIERTKYSATPAVINIPPRTEPPKPDEMFSRRAICPYCGCEVRDVFEMETDREYERDCTGCGKIIVIIPNEPTIFYTVRAK